MRASMAKMTLRILAKMYTLRPARYLFAPKYSVIHTFLQNIDLTHVRLHALPKCSCS